MKCNSAESFSEILFFDFKFIQKCFIIYKPCEQHSLIFRYISRVLLLMFAAEFHLTFLISLSIPHGTVISGDHTPHGICIEIIFAADSLKIINSLRAVLYTGDDSSYGVHHSGLFLGIVQILLLCYGIYLKHPSRNCISYSFFKCIAAESLDELVGILVRFHIDDSLGYTIFPQDCDSLQSCHGSRPVTVVGQICNIGKSFQEVRLILGKCRS